MVTILVIPTSVHHLKSLLDLGFAFCRNTLTQIISLENVTRLLQSLFSLLFSEIFKKKKKNNTIHTDYLDFTVNYSKICNATLKFTLNCFIASICSDKFSCTQ